MEIISRISRSEGLNVDFKTKTEFYCAVCDKELIRKRVLELIEESPKEVSIYIKKIEPEYNLQPSDND